MLLRIMRSFAALLSLTILVACSEGTPIKDLPDKNVSKKAREWKDPGAKPDPPRDAGSNEEDAGTTDSGVVDAGSNDAG